MQRNLYVAVFALLTAALTAWGEIKPPKPGWNLFSRDQDIQLGREAAAQVQRQMVVVHNPELENYVRTIGQRLVRSKYAGNYPYTFQVVSDPNINAFSLPGGPTFVNTGLIAAADNEAQLAGVLAHEVSHVALRHATNQASKQNLIALPAMLAGAVAGGSMLGSLAQLGIGLGANSVLLKFSRGAESQADYNGALIMADAGYNPIEMARFFEKLEAKAGNSSQFFSDHPNPGNRVRAVTEEVQEMPRQNYGYETGEFQRAKDIVLHLPAARQLRSSYQDQHTQGSGQQVPDIRPSRRFRQYSTDAYSISYPDNWQPFGDQNSPVVTIAPREALFQDQGGGVQIGYGVIASYYMPQDDRVDLRRDTEALVQQLARSNSGTRVQDQQQITVQGQQALITKMTSRSAYQGETEVDSIVTVPRPEGLFYLVFIAPNSEWRYVEPVFQEMLRTMRFRGQ